MSRKSLQISKLLWLEGWQSRCWEEPSHCNSSSVKRVRLSIRFKCLGRRARCSSRNIYLGESNDELLKVFHTTELIMNSYIVLPKNGVPTSWIFSKQAHYVVTILNRISRARNFDAIKLNGPLDEVLKDMDFIFVNIEKKISTVRIKTLSTWRTHNVFSKLILCWQMQLERFSFSFFIFPSPCQHAIRPESLVNKERKKNL